MPTLAEILGGIDSVVTPAKRRIVDALMNPKAYTQQAFGQVGDNMAQFSQNALRAQEGQDLTRMGSVMGEAPQYRNALSSIVNSLMGVAPIGATVWHGSPHKFDKFDASKIGTGEGAQAYGHGIYTAEAEKVASEYRKSLSNLYGIPTKVDGGGESIPIPQWLGDKINSEGIDSAIKEWTERLAQQRDAMKTSLQPWNHETNAIRFEKELEQMKRMKAANQASVAEPGYLYKVDLPDEHIAKMLDWDKPLSQQSPEVKTALQKRGFDVSGKDYGDTTLYDKFGVWEPKDLTGGVALERLHQQLGRKKLAEELQAQGIPGIRYLDGGSRGAGQGTSNYVVFPGNESLLNILERNGKPIK